MEASSSDNVQHVSERFASAVSALQNAGANYQTACFIIQSTGIAAALCERYVEMRTAEIDDYVLQNIVEAAYYDAGTNGSNF